MSLAQEFKKARAKKPTMDYGRFCDRRGVYLGRNIEDGVHMLHARNLRSGVSAKVASRHTELDHVERLLQMLDEAGAEGVKA